jgi:flagellar hook-length control protein FliK
MQLNGAKADPITGAVSATAPSNVDRPEDVMNVRSLIQSAQVLLRQGGGEMKVQMNPEGLGQVDLKVNVNDGKVEVQILAETADTKRLLEKNITDLRSSLSGHKLEVSDLKVDMAKAPEKDSNQTNNSDFNRDQARQFLGQFRDERDAMRNGMFELPNMRQYKPSKAKDIQPTTNSSEEKPATKGSNRLNVVV